MNVYILCCFVVWHFLGIYAIEAPKGYCVSGYIFLHLSAHWNVIWTSPFLPHLQKKPDVHFFRLVASGQIRPAVRVECANHFTSKLPGSKGQTVILRYHVHVLQSLRQSAYPCSSLVASLDSSQKSELSASATKNNSNI